MTVNLNGIKYETQILNELQKVNHVDFKFIDGKAGFSPVGTDIKFQYKDNIINCEIKMSDIDAQIGGTSITYNYSNNSFGWSKNALIDNVTQTDIINDYNSKTDNLNQLIEYLRKQKPTKLHELSNGFSMMVSREAWENAKNEKLLVPLNLKIKKDINWIYNHYANKNCFYIQIGSCGFFYLKDNPYDLPVEQLKGDFIQEIRVVRSGSSYNKKYDLNTSSACIRVQGRLKNVKPTKYTLENVNSIESVFNYKNVLNSNDNRFI